MLVVHRTSSFAIYELMNPLRLFLKPLKRLAKTDTVMSLRISVLERRRVRVRFDGKDWLMVWDGGGIAAPLPVLKPVHLSLSHIDLFTKHYQPQLGDTIVDVGAGCGDELSFFSQAVGPNGRVIAVEASPDCVERMRKLKRALSLENVTILHIAVGHHEGKAKMTTEAADSLSDRVISQEDAAQGVEVDVMTMDAVVEKFELEKVNYIKVNIEGAETDLLNGFYKHWRKVRNFCVSCHDFVSPEQRTYDAVRAWFTERELVPLAYEPTDYSRVWRNYYVFART